MIENRFRAWYRSTPSRPLILAHRGDSYHAPENTLEAAQVGLESGADGWELDVRLTRDEVAVVIHDESLLRTTDVARRHQGDPRASSGFLVADFDLNEIRALDAGSWFVDLSGGPRSALEFGTFERLDESARSLYASGKVRIPTLGEALELTAGLGRLVNVEIKPTRGDPVGTIESVVRDLRAAGSLAWSTVSSFDHELVALIAGIEPGVATGVLVDGPIDQPRAGWLGSIKVDALHGPPSVVGAGPLEVPTLVYTVNDAGPRGLAVKLAEAGVMGLFTDDPALLTGRFGLNPSSGRTRFR